MTASLLKLVLLHLKYDVVGRIFRRQQQTKCMLRMRGNRIGGVIKFERWEEVDSPTLFFALYCVVASGWDSLPHSSYHRQRVLTECTHWIRIKCWSSSHAHMHKLTRKDDASVRELLRNSIVKVWSKNSHKQQVNPENYLVSAEEENVSYKSILLLSPTLSFSAAKFSGLYPCSIWLIHSFFLVPKGEKVWPSLFIKKPKPHSKSALWFNNKEQESGHGGVLGGNLHGF